MTTKGPSATFRENKRREFCKKLFMNWTELDCSAPDWQPSRPFHTPNLKIYRRQLCTIWGPSPVSELWQYVDATFSFSKKAHSFISMETQYDGVGWAQAWEPVSIGASATIPLQELDSLPSLDSVFWELCFWIWKRKSWLSVAAKSIKWRRTGCLFRVTSHLPFSVLNVCGNLPGMLLNLYRGWWAVL